jgi:hypothetical protein
MSIRRDLGKTWCKTFFMERGEWIPTEIEGFNWAGMAPGLPDSSNSDDAFML